MTGLVPVDKLNPLILTEVNYNLIHLFEFLVMENQKIYYTKGLFGLTSYLRAYRTHAYYISIQV